MNVDTFMRNFGNLTEAPGGLVAVRRLILQLAMRGKLTDPGTADAGALVLRMSADKARKVESGQLRPSKARTPVSPHKTPFVIPPNWRWVQLGDAVHLVNGRAFKSAEWGKDGLPIIRIQNLNDVSASFNYCSFDVDGRFYVEDGDLLISWSGTPGTSFGAFLWMRGPAVLNQHIFRAELHGDAYHKDFLQYAINSQLDKMIAQAHGGVGLRHITKGKLETLCIPLPPLEEQQEIVKKIGETLSLCDELDARQQDRRAVHVCLNDVALDRLTSADDEADVVTAWNRVRCNFDLLYSTPDSVAALRRSILQFAVMGKLVPQNSADEPATTLIERIGTACDDLRRQWRCRRGERANAPTPRFEAPKTWEWVALDWLCFQITDGAHHTPRYMEDGVHFLSVKDISSGVIDLSNTRFISYEQHQELIGRCNPRRGDLLLTKIGTTGIAKVVDIDVEFSIFVSLALLKVPSQFVLPEFLELMLNSPLGRSQSKQYTQGVGNKNLVLKHIKNFAVVLPPFNEQARIVQRVKQLMALCDSLESDLVKRTNGQRRLAEAMVASVLTGASNGRRPSKSVVGAARNPGWSPKQGTVVAPRLGPERNREVMSSYIVRRLHKQPSFHRTKHAKLLSLAQAHVGADIGIAIERWDHGPFHPCLYDLERQAAEHGWYTAKTTKDKTTYSPGPKIADQVALAVELLGDRRAELDRLLDLLAPLSTHRAELIATTFFAWNDLLIDGAEPSDSDIADEFFRWHESKSKKFTPAKVVEALRWLRDNALVPTGSGLRTAMRE